MTIYTKPTITTLWADQGSYEEPDNAKILQGWVAEIPPYESQNWWQHRADGALRHIYEAGIPVWDGSTLYTAGRSIVQSSDGILWRALIDNTGQNPLTTGAWTPLIQTDRYVPPGAVMDFAMPTAPEGWLIADGTPISRTSYPALFAAIGTIHGAGDGTTTFNKPDYRGVFRRGIDLGRGLDPARVFASLQLSSNIQHSHSGETLSAGNHTHSGSTAAAGNHNHGGTTNFAGIHAHPQPAGVNGPYMFGGSSGLGNNGSMAGGPPASGFNNGFGTSWSGLYATGNAGEHQHVLNVDFAGGHTHGLTINSGGAHTHTFATNLQGGTEARPVNVAVLTCIKF
ncbi:Phage Tail Collar Domain protein [compost metagenome]